MNLDLASHNLSIKPMSAAQVEELSHNLTYDFEVV